MRQLVLFLMYKPLSNLVMLKAFPFFGLSMVNKVRKDWYEYYFLYITICNYYSILTLIKTKS